MRNFRKHALRLALLTGVVALPLAAIAQQVQPAAPALRDGSHDFDFWFGTWKEHSRRLLHPLTGSNDWVEMDGHSIVTKIWSGRANLVEYEGEGPNGPIELISLRTYSPQAHQWSVNFATPGVGKLGVPAIGEFRNGRGDFYDQEPFNGKMILVRFSVWSITPNSMQSNKRSPQMAEKPGRSTGSINIPAPVTGAGQSESTFRATLTTSLVQNTG